MPHRRLAADVVVRRAAGVVADGAGRPDVAVAVRVPLRQLRSPAVVGQVREALGRSGLEPGRLVLQVPEQALAGDRDGAGRLLQVLAGLGVGLALDDVASGPSSLRRLRQVPLVAARTPEDLLEHVADDPDDRAVLEVVLALLSRLGVRAVAAGVRTPGQLQVLRRARLPARAGPAARRLAAHRRGARRRRRGGPRRPRRRLLTPAPLRVRGRRRARLADCAGPAPPRRRPGEAQDPGPAPPPVPPRAPPCRCPYRCLTRTPCPLCPPPRRPPARPTPSTSTTRRCATARSARAWSCRSTTSSPIARHLDDLGVGLHRGRLAGGQPQGRRVLPAGPHRAGRCAPRSSPRSARPGGRGGDAAADLAHLRESGAGVVTLVAKSDVRHVERALRTTREENLAMVRDSVAHLRAEGQRVFLDAEHFFDGWAADPAYALEVLRVAAEAGADVAVLCDTNGGMLPHRLADVVAEVVAAGLRVGIHAHDDTACAVANSLAGGRRGRDARAGHGQRLRRALRQRRPVQRRRRARDQARPAGAAAGPPRRARPRRARRRRGREHRARRRTSRGSAPARSRTRPGCTSAPSRPTPTSTSTPTRPSSATTCACSSPSWPAARRSSSRAASSAWSPTATPSRGSSSG